jgi:hypothetical protein
VFAPTGWGTDEGLANPFGSSTIETQLLTRLAFGLNLEIYVLITLYILKAP